ncbi:hypothetical protein M9H77_06541 [Catharanthus roseus]|uniref:Uncharacterized protein n=1 Tax=Catharanthus roseus TaxID=4058 RepID=A0ACC0BSG5_CATRO|nr:hypothetical protein M9H77_06541 [Catharanthus roseus]
MNLGYTFGGSLFAFFSFRLFDGKNSDFLSSGKVLPVVEELEDLALYSAVEVFFNFIGMLVCGCLRERKPEDVYADAAD